MSSRKTPRKPDSKLGQNSESELEEGEIADRAPTRSRKSARLNKELAAVAAKETALRSPLMENNSGGGIGIDSRKQLTVLEAFAGPSSLPALKMELEVKGKDGGSGSIDFEDSELNELSREMELQAGDNGKPESSPELNKQTEAEHDSSGNGNRAIEPTGPNPFVLFKTTNLSNEPIKLLRINSVEEMDAAVLKERHRLLSERFKFNQLQEKELLAKIDQLKNAQIQAVENVNTTNRYFDQFNEDVSMLLGRFDPSDLRAAEETTGGDGDEEIGPPGPNLESSSAEAASSFLTATKLTGSTLDKDGDGLEDNKLAERIQKSTAVFEKLLQAFNTLKSRYQKGLNKKFKNLTVADDLNELNSDLQEENKKLQVLINKVQQNHRQQSLEATELAQKLKTAEGKCQELKVSVEDLSWANEKLKEDNFKLSNINKNLLAAIGKPSSRISNSRRDADHSGSFSDDNSMDVVGIPFTPHLPSEEEQNNLPPGASGSNSAAIYHNLQQENQRLQEKIKSQSLTLQENQAAYDKANKILLEKLARTQFELEHSRKASSSNSASIASAYASITDTDEYKQLCTKYDSILQQANKLKQDLTQQKLQNLTDRTIYEKSLEKLEIKEQDEQKKLRDEISVSNEQYNTLKLENEVTMLTIQLKTSEVKEKQLAAINLEMKQLIENAKACEKKKELSRKLVKTFQEEEEEDKKNKYGQEGGELCVRGRRADADAEDHDQGQTTYNEKTIATDTGIDMDDNMDVSESEGSGSSNYVDALDVACVSSSSDQTFFSLNGETGSGIEMDVIDVEEEDLGRKQFGTSEACGPVPVSPVQDYCGTMTAETSNNREMRYVYLGCEKGTIGINGTPVPASASASEQQTQDECQIIYDAASEIQTKTYKQLIKNLKASLKESHDDNVNLLELKNGLRDMVRHLNYKYRKPNKYYGIKTDLSQSEKSALLEIPNLKTKIQILEKQLGFQKLQSDSLQYEIEVTDEALDEQREQTKRLISLIHEKDARNIELMHANAKSIKMKELKQQENILLEEQMKMLHEQIKEQREVMKKLETQVRGLKHRLLATQKKIVDYEQETTRMGQNIQDNNNLVNELEHKLKTSLTDLETLRQKFIDKSAEFEGGKIEIKRLEDSVKKLEDKLKVVVAENEQAQAQARLMTATATADSGNGVVGPQQQQQQQAKPAVDDKDMDPVLVEFKERLTCGICTRNMKNCILTKCCHVFCMECIEARYNNRNRKCPQCNASFGLKDYTKIFL